MAVCPNCGAESFGAYCSKDGTRLDNASAQSSAPPVVAPPKARRSPLRVAGLVLLGLLLLLVAGVAAVFIGARRDTVSSAEPPVVTVTTTASVPAAAAGTTGTAAPTTTSATTTASTSTTTNPEAAALASLNSERDKSRAGLKLDGRWVLQLASKADGTVDQAQVAANGTHVFHLADVVAQFQQLTTKASQAGMSTKVVLASDFGTRQAAGNDKIWVLLAEPGTVPSQSAAQAKCAALFPGETGTALTNDCLPRTLVQPS